MFYYYVLNVLRWFADCYARCVLLDQLSQVKTRSDKQNATFILYIHRRCRRRPFISWTYNSIQFDFQIV